MQALQPRGHAPPHRAPPHSARCYTAHVLTPRRPKLAHRPSAAPTPTPACACACATSRPQELFQDGGKLIWVAPSGGRDRADETGTFR
eukprot:6402070-Prymnesium_polylepis.1